MREERERTKKNCQRLGKGDYKEGAEETRKAKKEGEGSATQQDGEVERLQLEKERMERKERQLKGILKPPVFSASGHSAPPFHSSAPIPSLSISSSPSQPPAPVREAANRKKCKRKYCLTLLTLDPCWMKVEMTGVDGVGVHCRLLFGRRV